MLPSCPHDRQVQAYTPPVQQMLFVPVVIPLTRACGMVSFDFPNASLTPDNEILMELFKRFIVAAVAVDESMVSLCTSTANRTADDGTNVHIDFEIRGLTPEQVQRFSAVEIEFASLMRAYVAGGSENRSVPQLRNQGHRGEFAVPPMELDGIDRCTSIVVFRPGGNHDQCCAVCLTDFEEGETLRVLPCGHRFHDTCADQWLLRSAQCPICRSSVKSTVAASRRSRRLQRHRLHHVLCC